MTLGRTRSVLAAAALATSVGLGCGSPDDAIGPSYPVPYAAVGDYLGIYDGQTYQPIFLKGVNLAVAVPGTRPGEMAATTEDYERWLQQLTDLGANCIRIYTLHYPRFYEVLDRHNRAHAEHPLYVLHGIWLDEEDYDEDLHSMNPEFDRGVLENVDAVHGQRHIGSRHGRAYGDYTVDASRWVIGWLVGREVYASEAVGTNRRHPENTSYSGPNFRMIAGNPTEVWWAERLDKLVSYERGAYGVERPVATSNWPTLDPLDHITEGVGSFEDVASVDMENLEAVNAPAGSFLSYHVYPNYPDFMNDQPDYQDATDSLGKNSYLAYLKDLKAHYPQRPVVVSEFGVPTSWGIAHFGQSGMHHGGHDEEMQGVYTARMIGNINATRYAGAINFAWIDEWWKSTWVITPQAFPIETYPNYHNLLSPEQNYGLVAFDPPPPNYDEWPATTGGVRIRSIQASHNAEFFYLKLALAGGLAATETLDIGFDTYADDRGESVLPSGVKTVRRHELALEITRARTAQLYVTQAYDLFSIWDHSSAPEQLYHSVPTDGAPWRPVRWRNKGERSWRDGTSHPGTIAETGQLRVHLPGAKPTTLDAVDLADDGAIEVRIPWFLLQFADPTSLRVMDDDRATPDVTETAESEGIAVTVSVGGELLDTGRFVWPAWDRPPATVERDKASIPAFSQAMREADVLR